MDRNRNDYENQMFCMGLYSEIRFQYGHISFFSCLPKLMKGHLSSGMHNCYMQDSSVCSYHHGFYTTWYFFWQFKFITSEIVIFEIQDIGNIYFYLKLLGGFVRQYSVPQLWKRFYNTLPLNFQGWIFITHTFQLVIIIGLYLL